MKFKLINFTNLIKINANEFAYIRFISEFDLKLFINNYRCFY